MNPAQSVNAQWHEAMVVAAQLATAKGRMLTLEVPGWPGSDAGNTSMYG